MTKSDKSVTRLAAFIREHVRGGCRILTMGDACPCLLCDLDRLASPSAVQLPESSDA